MESVKQERHDLLNDNPVDRTASGDRSFMSKHTHGSVGSPLHKRPKPGATKPKPSKPSGTTKPQLPAETPLEHDGDLKHMKKGHVSNDGGKTYRHEGKA